MVKTGEQGRSKQKTYRGRWSSDRAEAKFRSKEDVVWARANPRPEEIDVTSQFGSTRVYRWPGEGTPIVFLHGMTDTSVRWIPYGEALAGHDVYAIDIMGDVGRSVHEVGFTGADDYASWLGETFDALGIDKPHLVGASLGGYLAFAYAMVPGRVSSLIGLDPVGVADLKLFRLMRWSFRCALAAFMPQATRGKLARKLRQPLLADKPAMDLLLQAQRGHPVKVPPLPVFTDEQLGSIQAPVHVLAAADSAAFNTDELVERINATVPRGSAHLLPDAGHGFSDSHFNDCLTLIRRAISVTV